VNLADLMEVFKMINGQTNVKFEVFFEFDTNNRTRGHAHKVKKNRFNRDLRQHFFTERVINIWNNLDQSREWVMGHGSWVKWVTKIGWVTWVIGH